MREKVELGFKPQWEGPIKGWAIKYINKNKWRVDPIFEQRDLLQDAYLVYLKIVDYYPSVRDPRHFMALFKTAFRNEMTNHARCMEYKPEEVSVEVDIPEFTNWGYVSVLLSQMPELSSVLRIYVDPEKLAELVKEEEKTKFSRETLKVRENLNAKLVRLAGLDPNLDIVSKLREIFT